MEAVTLSITIWKAQLWDALLKDTKRKMIHDEEQKGHSDHYID